MFETDPELSVSDPSAASPSESAPASSVVAEPTTDEAPVKETADAKPSDRIRIGTQRAEDQAEKLAAKSSPVGPHIEGETRPAKPQAAAGKHYPPPNIRDTLSPELEAELEAALAGESIDALLDSGSAAVAEEVPDGTRLTGTVANIYQDNIFVDLGGRNQGAIAVKHFEGKEIPEPGASIEVVVVRFVADDGLYDLSPPGAAVTVGNWDDVEEGQTVEVTITGSNKGGLECQLSGLRGFMPMGQISIYRVENPEEYVGQRITAVVTEANRSRRNLVLSHRAVMEREQAENREKLLAELAPGQMREGIVRSLRDFGAFVDLGGVDGLIHVSKMSWDRVNHPSEVLTEGQTVKVKIERIDPDTGKIGLSYKESAENPWDSVETKYTNGMRVSGDVTKIMDFGAFVKLEPGIEGLIHISELAHGRVFRTSDAVSEGQAVEVKILSVDRDQQRIGLSLKALMEPPKKAGSKDDAEPTDFSPPPGAPKVPQPRKGNLKGGTGSPSGGELFGLKW